MRLIFIRHGETDWNVQKKIQGCTDIALNEMGLLQAESLGRQLQREDMHISKIYCSRLERAKETAKIIGEILKVPYEALEGLEEMNLGLWEGKTWKEVPELYPEEYDRWHNDRRYTRTPEGESYQDVLERVLKALRQVLIREKEDADILIVTHSAIIMTLLSYINATPFHEMAKRYKVRNAGMVIVEKGDLDIIRG